MKITIKQALINGIKAHKAGNAQEAAQYYLAILKTIPDHPDANHNLGVLAASNGKVEEAIPFFRKALDAEPKVEQFWLSLLDALYNCDKLEEANHILDASKKENFNNKAFSLFEKKLRQAKSAAIIPNNQKSLEPNFNEPEEDDVADLIKLHSKGQFDAVLEKLAPMLKIFPTSLVLLNISGSTYASLNQFDKAIRNYKKALKINPTATDIQNNIGVLLAKKNDLETAIRWYKAAIENRPNFFEAHENLGLAYINSGQLTDALNCFKAATAISPEAATPFFNMGNIYMKLKKFNEGIQCFKKAITLEEKYSEAYSNLGILLRITGRLDESIENFRKALALNSYDAQTLNNLGIAYLDNSEPTNAISSFMSAIKINPELAEAVNNLGNAYQEKGDINQAKKYYEKTLDISPTYAPAYFNLGNAYRSEGESEEAIENYQKAIKYDRNYADAHNNLGNALQDLGKLDLAIKHYKICADINPEYAPRALSNIGIARKEQGRTEEAADYYRKAISIDPCFAEAHRHLSIITRYTKKTEHFYVMKKIDKRQTLDEYSECNLQFALAKAYEDLEEFDMAFACYIKGNSIRKKLLNYNIEKDRKLFSISLASQKKFYRNSFEISNGEKISTPIFIVGMPRSGTTLIEQIISSHTDVKAGGELELVSRLGSKFFVDETRINLKELEGFRASYLNALDKISDGKSFTTDKMPGNFLFLPLIIAALPEAKIIHVARSHPATCWSNFKQYFSQDGNGYCYNLADIVEYYKMYKSIMETWESLYPQRIIQCDYDVLTANPNIEIMKLISAVNLSWENNFLSPHKNKRSVKTASQLQVRKKIYAGSSKDWKKFENLLNGIFEKI